MLEYALLRMRELLLLRRRIADSTLEEDHSGEAILDEVEERMVQPAKEKITLTLLNYFNSFKGTVSQISWE
jgi:hypothetical protein